MQTISGGVVLQATIALYKYTVKGYKDTTPGCQNHSKRERQRQELAGRRLFKA
jgi:hypothetical protein